jgi:hypothetical protein
MIYELDLNNNEDINVIKENIDKEITNKDTIKQTPLF